MIIEKIHHEPKRKKTEGSCRTAAYCRVSTQLEDQEGSFETQQNYYRQLIENDSGKVLAGIYADQMSGLHTDNRKGFQQMMQDCREGKIDLVITRSVSRLSRNMGECLKTISELKALGIPIVFEKEHITSTDPDSELFLSVLATMAQEESNFISIRLRQAYRHRAALGIPNRCCPYGYRKEPVKRSQRSELIDRKWLIYEPEAKRVRLAFDMANELYFYEDILNALNNMEISENTGVYWSHHRVYYLLKNEAYKGDIITHKTYIKDYLSGKVVINHGEHEQFYIEEHHEPIVKPEVFDRVNRLISCGLLSIRSKHKREKLLREENL